MNEDLDDKIEDKLMKLKRFNQTWLGNCQTDEEICEEVNERFEKLKLISNDELEPKLKGLDKESKNAADKLMEAKDLIDKKETIDVIPVCSTSADSRLFNEWYENQIITRRSQGKVLYQNQKRVGNVVNKSCQTNDIGYDDVQDSVGNDTAKSNLKSKLRIL